MRPFVYVETTVVSLLTARPSGQLVTAAHQHLTKLWWENHAPGFRLVASELVVSEASAGDPAAAAERARMLATLPLVPVSAIATDLARVIIESLRLPARAQADAFHVAIAATNAIDYLLTWNCRHLTNAVLRPQIERICVNQGYRPPIICSPADLVEDAP